jgi:prostaglandin-H2 D-isomerase / glutathione transferase
MPAIKLTYFNSQGRAEPIRVALRLGQVPFEDHRIDFPAFSAAKAAGELPLGQVPVLEVDGFRMVQTPAILRYASRIGDETLYPTDPWAALLVDSALDSLNDNLSHALLPSLFERDPAKKLALRLEFAAGPMATVLSYVEGLVERSGGPFVGGPRLSIGDLVVATQLLQIRSGGLDGLTTAHLEPYPRLVRLVDAYLAEPRIAALRE